MIIFILFIRNHTLFPMTSFGKNKTNRRNFLGTVLGGATAFGLASIVSPTQMSAAAPVAKDLTDAQNWFKQLKGKQHKLVIDVTAPHNGAALRWSSAFLDAHNDYGVTDKDLAVVIVFRSMGTVMALNDSIWLKYTVGKRAKLTDVVTKEDAVRNLFWNPKEGDEMDKEDSIDFLQKRGVMFCVCRNAVEGMAEGVAEQLELKKEDVIKEFKENILPGIQVVPAGIWAVSHAQELGCAFCFGG